MCVFRGFLLVAILWTDLGLSHHTSHKSKPHTISRANRAVDNGPLRFEPEPYNKKLEFNSSGKIHCKVAGGVSPSVQWFLNDNDPLPEGVTSSNGTLLVTSAARAHAGRYTCRATDGPKTIQAQINLDVVSSPKILEPEWSTLTVVFGSWAALHCRSIGDPEPTTHWDRNLTILNTQQEGVEMEGGANESNARIILFKNGTLLIRGVQLSDSDHYGCTAGSVAGLARREVTLVVLPEGEALPPQESTGVAGKAVIVSISVAGAYMILVLALMVYCRRRRLRRRQRGEKLELEAAEGRQKLVESGETRTTTNGRLLAPDRDSGADNSEVSAISRASKKSGQYDHLAVPRSLLTDQIVLGRGEFGDVLLATIDMGQVRRLRGREGRERDGNMRVLVKALTAKEETQLAEFRRQLELFGRVRHANIVRLIGLCTDGSPHYMLLEHTEWGDLKTFLLATRAPPPSGSSPPAGSPLPLKPPHAAMLALQLANAAQCLAAKRMTHRDIASRNCCVTPSLGLKLSAPGLSRGPRAEEYYKMHDQVVPLRWLPTEAVLEGDYSTKSDVYMFAATVWEIYTKAELPFAKLNDNSVLERLKNGSLEWSVPEEMPEKMAALLKRCWSKSPSNRPQFTEISEEMTVILQEITAENPLQDASEENKP